MNDLVSNVRRLLRPSEVARARAWHARALRDAELERRPGVAEFESAFRCRPGTGCLVLARARTRDGEPYWAGTPLRAYLGLHSWITGASGSGKSMLALAIIIQLLTRTRVPMILIDFKNELADLLTDVVLPAFAQLGHGDRLLEHLRIVRPFDGRFLPHLRVTRPEARIAREVQALTIAAALEEALADGLGQRMRRLFLKLASLCIELDAPLPVIRDWLEDPRAFARAAQGSRDRSLRQYGLNLLEREHRASIEALLARADVFLLLPETRLALSAPSCISFADALERGLTIVGLGEPPAGAEALTRFYGGILIGMLMRAILSRPIRPETPPVPVIFDEFQEGMQTAQAAQFSRLTALARYKRVAFTFINQHPGQLSAVDPGLIRALRTNTGIECAFRANLEDARAYAHALPVPASSRSGEVRQSLVEELTRLERREFLLWIKGPVPAQRVRSPRLDLDGLRTLAADAPDDVRSFVQQGTVASERGELERFVSRRAPEEDETEPPLLTPELDAVDEVFPRLG